MFVRSIWARLNALNWLFVPSFVFV
jgi:hypothetical protein